MKGSRQLPSTQQGAVEVINKKEAEAKVNAQIDATSDCLRRVMAALIDRKVHETCSAGLAHIKKSAVPAKFNLPVSNATPRSVDSP